MLLIFNILYFNILLIYIYNARRCESLKSLVREVTEVKMIEGKKSINNRKTQYVQDKNPASSTRFENQTI